MDKHRRKNRTNLSQGEIGLIRELLGKDKSPMAQNLLPLFTTKGVTVETWVTLK